MPAPHASRRLACCVFTVIAAAALLADPPKVVRAVPDNGDSDVDPALSEIRIEFDQDMNPSGHSICGGGPTFPQLVGKPRWQGKRTFILSVKLKPGATYQLSVNCPSARNTRSATGEPAESYPISFTTRAANAEPEKSPPRLTAEQNQQAIERLRQAIEKKYSYRDLHGVDWNQAIDEFAPKLKSAETPAAFGREVARLLERARDIHNTVRVGEQILATFRSNVTPNASAELLAKLVPDLQKESGAVWIGRFEDGIGYINLTTWSSEKPELYKAAYAALDKFAGAKGLVVDVRFNSGGDELIAREFASCFVEKPAVYSRSRYRDDAGKDGFGPSLPRKIEPHAGRKAFAGKVALLMGPANMSSCESFLKMMKTAPRVRTFGAKTRGASGNPKPHDLGNGVTVMLSSWQDLTPEGELIEGRGIAPDEPVSASIEAVVDTDPVLTKALEWLRN